MEIFFRHHFLSPSPIRPVFSISFARQRATTTSPMMSTPRTNNVLFIFGSILVVIVVAAVVYLFCVQRTTRIIPSVFPSSASSLCYHMNGNDTATQSKRAFRWEPNHFFVTNANWIYIREQQSVAPSKKPTHKRKVDANGISAAKNSQNEGTDRNLCCVVLQ